MTLLLHDLAWAALVGLGATALFDLWGAALRRAFGLASLDMALLGRWAGHLARGRLAHAAIARAAPVRGERALGWAVHYGIGVAFAGLLLALAGRGWAAAPTPGIALAVGLATAAAPLFVMQPAMGAGFAARRTPTPWRHRLRVLINHAVFGLALHAGAVLLAHATTMPLWRTLP